MADLPEMLCATILEHPAHDYTLTWGFFHCPGNQRTSNPDLPFIEELSQDELAELNVHKLDQMVLIKDHQIAHVDEYIRSLERRLVLLRSRRNAFNLRRRAFIAEQERRK